MPRSAQSRSTFPILSLALLVCAAAYFPAVAAAQVAGTISLVGKPNDHPGKGPGGALVFIGESKGRNESSGKSEFMAGADVVSADTVSLVNGSGMHQGVLTMSKGGNQVSFKWSGQVTTTVDQAKKPVTSFQGTWTVVAGGSGRGTYVGRFTSPVASVIEWKGEVGK